MAAAAANLPSLMAKFLLMTVALGFRTHMRDLLFCLVWAFPFVLMIYSPKAMRKAAACPPLCGSTYRQERCCREERDRPHKDRSATVWTFEENKRFENALAMLTTNEANPHASFFGFAKKVAPEFPGKSVGQIHSHLAALVHELGLIESGEIPFPEQWMADEEGEHTRAGGDIDDDSSSSSSGGSKARRRGWIIWTDDERESFLRGLDIYGFGHWRLISANVVFSKTWREVARYAEALLQRGPPRQLKTPSNHVPRRAINSWDLKFTV